MRLVLLGSGNVATHLARGLRSCCDIVQIYSRTLSHAERLAREVGCRLATDDLKMLVRDADVYVVSVIDDALADVLSQVPDNGALWLHTSGTMPLTALSVCRTRCGVLYPMQSFSRTIDVDWKQVHAFVEGNTPESMEQAAELARMLTPYVTPCDSHQRAVLHVAAVFSCNFANHLWAVADELLQENGLSFDAMMPLIENTVAKLRQLSPRESQTGPAVRGDQEVMNKHLEMLQGKPREIYGLLSSSIGEMKSRPQIDNNHERH